MKTATRVPLRLAQSRSAVVLGVGFDLLHVRRVEEELSRGPWLADDGIFTLHEIQHCSAAREPALRYAACFAAKEATLKALGLAAEDLAMFREVELRAAANGAYEIILQRRAKEAAATNGVRRIHLSLARSSGLAAAVVILEA